MKHNALFSNPLGKRLSIRDYKKAWFGGKFFRNKSPFLTFAQQNRFFLRDIVNKWGKNYRIESALEIGPGNAPILLGSEIPEVYLMDKSKKLCEDLRKKGATATHSKVVIENKDFQKSTWGNFGLIVLNEVLCMVRPKDRIKQLKRIIRHSKCLLLIERVGMPLKGLESIIVTIGELENMKRLLEVNNWNLEYRVVSGKDYDYAIIAARKI